MSENSDGEDEFTEILNLYVWLILGYLVYGDADSYIDANLELLKFFFATFAAVVLCSVIFETLLCLTGFEPSIDLIDLID